MASQRSLQRQLGKRNLAEELTLNNDDVSGSHGLATEPVPVADILKHLKVLDSDSSDEEDVHLNQSAADAFLAVVQDPANGWDERG